MDTAAGHGDVLVGFAAHVEQAHALAVTPVGSMGSYSKFLPEALARVCFANTADRAGKGGSIESQVAQKNEEGLTQTC